MRPRLITRRGELVASGDRPAPTEPAGENVGDYGEICLTASEMCFARERTTFGCCEMPAGVRRFISFHIAAKTQYITMHSTLVCEALFHILRQQNISLKTNRRRPAPTEPAGENVGDYGEICLTASELFAP